MHYQRLMRGAPEAGPAEAFRITSNAGATCSEPGCSRNVHARGLCYRHYKIRWDAGAFGGNTP